MSTSTPIPVLPKVPGAAVIGLLLLQFAITNVTSSHGPQCSLKIQKPHKSTHAAEFQGRDIVKLKVTSECNQTQDHTQIDVTILEERANKLKAVAHFSKEIALADATNQRIANFEQITAPCEPGKNVSYVGKAKGFAYLKDGQKIKVKGDSGNSFPVPCMIKAQ